MSQTTPSENSSAPEQSLPTASQKSPHRRHRRRRPSRPNQAYEKNTMPGRHKDGRHAVGAEEPDASVLVATTEPVSMPSHNPSGAVTPEPKRKVPALSIVIPLFNEAESLPELYGKLGRMLNRLRVRTEIIFVDDGSTDNSFKTLRRLQLRDRRVRVIQFRRNYGKSAALAAGFSRAQGRHIVTLDADLQDDPDEIPQLLRELDKGYDLISGWKKRRHDKFTKRLASKIFNAVTSSLTGLRLHDINCGLKAYRREVTDSISVYGQLHRYLPVLAFKEGFHVGEIEVQHHPRKYGRSKFGLSRYTNGFFDLLTVLFLTRYTKRPLHLFGLGGLVSFLLGLGISAYLTYERLFGNRYLTNRPLLFLGILLIIIGVQMVSFGLLGEMIAATQSQAPSYSVKAELGFDNRG